MSAWPALLALLVAGAGPDDPPTAKPPATVAAIREARDRQLVRDLVAYLKANPEAADRDEAYLLLFDTAIDREWFAEAEPVAAGYLGAQADGPVAPLARIVATMARANAGEFSTAIETYNQLLAGLDPAENAEFAVSFAENLGIAALTAGQHDVARQVYAGLLKALPDNPAAQQKATGELARLDQVGQAAPELTGNDIAGKPIKLSDYRGKYVLIDYWATWCAPCVGDIPGIEAAYAKYRAKGLEVVSVSLDDTREAAADFVAARKLPWRQVHNATGGVDWLEAFHVQSIPCRVLVGPDGKVVRLEPRGDRLDKILAGLIR